MTMPQRWPTRTLTFVALGLVTACGGQQETARKSASSLNDSELAAIVNGEQISNLQVQRHAAQRGSGDAPADPAVATQELINLLLLSQEATRRGLHTQPATVEELARQRIAVLANALLENQMETMQIEEADLRAEYRSQTTAMEDTEYQARHILLSDKQQADEVIDQLRFGADFDELARTKSTGPSAKQGGALGWFRAGQMVPPFSQALHRLQVGEVSEPVQTKFGWHVIQLQNKRKVPVPEFAAVEARLQTIVRNKRLRELVDGLRAKAEIELRSAH